MDPPAEGRTSMTGRLSRQTKRRRSSNTVGKRVSLGSAKAAIMMEPRIIPQRVFLYMQLKNIIHLPVVSYPLELHLYHVKNTLQKMSEQYTKETIIYQNEFDMEKPAFAMGIIQDSIEDMNLFSDNPLVVSLYQRIPRHRRCDLKLVSRVRTDASAWTVNKDSEKSNKSSKEQQAAGGDMPAIVDMTSRVKENHTAGRASPAIVDMVAQAVASTSIDDEDEFPDEGCEDDEYEEESLEFLSRGHCDLLQLFQRKRFISNIPIMLYPEYEHKLQTSTSQKITTTSEWHMYSIIPLLKNFHFTNLAFITFESIYHAPEELHELAGHLGLNLCLRSTKPDINQEYRVIPFCSFYGFTSQIICEQNTIVVWENIKRDLLNNSRFSISNNQIEANLHIKLPRLFRHLLQTPGVNLKMNEINLFVDSALINNSQHRYVLTSEMREILESAVVHNDYELVLQLYDEIPVNVLYEGTINPSIFGYPDVNVCRFASVLSPLIRKTRTTRKTFRKSDTIPPEAPMFAIVKICFFQSLTKRNEPLDAYNENQLKTAKLRRCMNLESPNNVEDNRDILKELYRSFDDLIRDLISFIVRNEVDKIDEKRNYFCCHLGNLRNLLVDLCGCDFNVRMPTKTNIEFREMLTHLYKELMERIEGLLTACSWESISNCVILPERNNHKTRRLLEEYRVMCIIGECTMAKQLFVEIRAGCPNKTIFNFFVFLNSVESLNFAHAEKYLRYQRETNWNGDYFVSLLKIYVDYKVQLKSNETPDEAFPNMIEKLRVFASQNKLDKEAWILLHCYYKHNQYLPGMEYTRWKYENLYDIPSKTMPFVPRPLYESFLPSDFELTGKSLQCNKFYNVFMTFACLGAYGFAEVIFDEISADFTPTEVYLIKTTLKMLQGETDILFQVKKMPTDNSAKGKLLQFYQSHINGNVEYSRHRYEEAIQYYKDLLAIDIEDKELLSIFYISLIRLGRLSFDSGDYELSRQAYELCLPESQSDKNIVANYNMGLCLYYLNRLEEAIEYLSRSTENEIFLPDAWGYLAIINLRLGRNKTALNCWEIAKMYPEIPLNNRIYTELDKIKYSDICIMVEDDCKPR